tara:strand:- start:923 stop:1234 length:312 start_codon:yes stop_codon:yes gene_type:complete
MGPAKRPRSKAAVIEVFAAIIGASVGVAGLSASGFSKRNNESREAVIRLTAGVESIASKLDELHLDMKEDRRQMYSRLNDHDIRIAQLEGRLGKYHKVEKSLE